MYEATVNELTANLETVLTGNIYIHAGVERHVEARLWEDGNKKRTYLSIKCYSLMGRHKGTYKCGYVDMHTGEYVVGKWDDMNAETLEYLK